MIIIKNNVRNDKKILPRLGFDPTPDKGEQHFGNSYEKM